MTTIDNAKEIEEAFLAEYLQHKRGEAPEAMRVLLKPSDIGALVRIRTNHNLIRIIPKMEDEDGKQVMTGRVLFYDDGYALAIHRSGKMYEMKEGGELVPVTHKRDVR